MKIMVVSCAKSKQPDPCWALRMYNSVLFKKSMQLADRILLLDVKNTIILILSARYGLIQPYEIIKPYDEILTSKNKCVITKLITYQLIKMSFGFIITHIWFFGGKKYSEVLKGALNSSIQYYDVFEGLSIGKRLQFLNKTIKFLDSCE